MALKICCKHSEDIKNEGLRGGDCKRLLLRYMNYYSQNCEEWKKEKFKRLTASNFGKICKLRNQLQGKKA